METVTFQCGQCGKLMAVTTAHLGQQVRCPHCQQVVVAPPPVSETPLPPQPLPELTETVTSPPVEMEHESIFAPPPPVDDLFGEPSAPRLELPPEPTWVQPPPAPPGPPPMFQPPVPPPPLDQTVAYAPPGTSPAPPAREPVASDPFAPAAPSPDLAADEEGQSMLPRAPAVRVPRSSGGGWLLPALIVPLISYAVLATVALGMLMWQASMQAKSQQNLLDLIPDIDGDNPGAVHSGKVRKIDYGSYPLLTLPANEKIHLGESKTVGDLRLTPTRVERSKVLWYTQGFAKPETSAEEVLVLFLEMENVSRDVSFYPTDMYFNREWKARTLLNCPFSYLEMDKDRFFGPCEWYPKTDARHLRVSVKLPVKFPDGTDSEVSPHYEEELKPGQKMSTFICTNPGDKVAERLDHYHGPPLIYRVQFRRGLVMGPKGKEVSATAVLGVEFTPQEVKKAA